VSRLHIADTGLFVAMGQPSNSRYQAVRRFARQNDVTFVLPERVCEELTVDDPDVENPPVDTGSTDSTYRLRINVEPAMLEPAES